MGRPPTFTAEQKARALELYAEHGARRAKELCAEQEDFEVSVAAIHKWARAAGVETRSLGTRANQVQGSRLSAEVRKLALADGLLDDAQRIRSQLFARTTVHSFGGADYGFHEAELSRPTAADQQKMMTSIAIAVDKIQLLTGAATSRDEHTVTDRSELAARAAELDELAAKRAQRGAM